MFTAQPEPISGSFSIDPASFVDDDGQAYMYFGGLRGGQLEKWRTGQWDPDGFGPGPGEPALRPRVAKLSADMLHFDGTVKEVAITDNGGKPISAGDSDRLYFEAPWVYKHNGLYYLVYSTGDTHYYAYATGTSPWGPFTYKGRVLNPVIGWTTHGSIVDYRGKTYLFYADASLSGGVDNKRCIKYSPLTFGPDNVTINTISPERARGGALTPREGERDP